MPTNPDEEFEIDLVRSLQVKFDLIMADVVGVNWHSRFVIEAWTRAGLQCAHEIAIQGEVHHFLEEISATNIRC